MTIIENPHIKLNNYNITIQNFDNVFYDYIKKENDFQKSMTGSTTIPNVDLVISANRSWFSDYSIITNYFYNLSVNGLIFNLYYYEGSISFSIKNPPNPPLEVFIVLDNKLAFFIPIRFYS